MRPALIVAVLAFGACSTGPLDGADLGVADALPPWCAWPVEYCPLDAAAGCGLIPGHCPGEECAGYQPTDAGVDCEFQGALERGEFADGGPNGMAYIEWVKFNVGCACYFCGVFAWGTCLAADEWWPSGGSCSRSGP